MNAAADQVQLHPHVKDFYAGRFPDPDRSRAAAVLETLKLGLDNWLAVRGRPVILWGWHPSDLNTMLFEHESIRRAFHFIGFDTFWYGNNADPAVELARHAGPRIFISGGGIPGDRLIPHVREDDVLILHNEFEPKRWPKGKIINYTQFALPSHWSPGFIAHYPADLLPHEIDPGWLAHKQNKIAFFVGSPYSESFKAQHHQLSQSFRSIGVEYAFLENWNPTLIHQSYIVSRWLPVPQLPELTAFLPSRFCKGMSRGCIPLSINPVLRTLLGSGSDACVFGADWPEVMGEVQTLLAHPDWIEEKSRLAMKWASSVTALQFLEYIWPPENAARRSRFYWDVRECVQRGDALLSSLSQLRLMLERYPNNRAAMYHLGCMMRKAGMTEELARLADEYRARFPDDKLVFNWYQGS